MISSKEVFFKELIILNQTVFEEIKTTEDEVTKKALQNLKLLQHQVEQYKNLDEQNMKKYRTAYSRFILIQGLAEQISKDLASIAKKTSSQLKLAFNKFQKSLTKVRKLKPSKEKYRVSSLQDVIDQNTASYERREKLQKLTIEKEKFLGRKIWSIYDEPPRRPVENKYRCTLFDLTTCTKVNVEKASKEKASQAAKEVFKKIFILLVSPLMVMASSDTHHQAANELLDVANFEQVMEDAITIMMDMQLQSNPALLPYEKIFKDFITKHMGANSLREEIAALYVETFTEKELKEITTFYSTEAGKKALLKMPELMQRSGEIGQRRMEKNMNELESLIAEEAQRLAETME